MKAYGNIPIPGRMDEMTYNQAFVGDQEQVDRYFIKRDLMRLYERDVATILEDRGK